MFTCDYILANQDRHWRNFRGNPRMLKHLNLQGLRRFSIMGQAFGVTPTTFSLKIAISRNRLDRKVWLLTSSSAFSGDYSWFDRDKLVGFPLEAKEILSHGNDGIQARLDVIESRIERNIGGVQRHIEKLAIGQREPLHVKRDKVLQIPRMNDSVSKELKENGNERGFCSFLSVHRASLFQATIGSIWKDLIEMYQTPS